MRIKAVLEVSVYMQEDESIEEANNRAIETLVEVIDEWVNEKNGTPPYIKLEYDLDQDYIKEIKILN